MAWRNKDRGERQVRPTWMVENDYSSSSSSSSTSSKSRLEAFNALNAKFQNRFTSTSTLSSSAPSSSSVEADTTGQRKSRFSSATDDHNTHTGFVPGMAGLYIPPKRHHEEITTSGSSNSSGGDFRRSRYDVNIDVEEREQSVSKGSIERSSKERIKETGGLYFPGPEEPVVAGCALPPPEPSDSMSKAYLTMSKHRSRVNAIRFTKKGDYAMTCSEDRTAMLWNPLKEDPSTNCDENMSALLIKTYEGAHGYGILDLCIASDNTKFATVGGDKTAFVWDVTTGTVTRRFTGHNARINTCTMNDYGTLLFTGSYDATVCIWDLRSHNREPIQKLCDLKDSVTSLAVTNQEILVGNVDATVRVYDIRAQKMHTDPRPESVICIRSVKNNLCALSACLDQKIYLSEIASGVTLKTYEGHMNKEYKIECDISYDDNSIVAGSEDGYMFIWDLMGGLIRKKLRVHEKCVSAVACHPSKDVILTSSLDGTAKCWLEMFS